MAKRDLPGIGLKGNYSIGEDGWGDDQNLNLLKISALTQGHVLSRLAAVPGAPTQGDVHILTADPNESALAIYDGGAWMYLTPEPGWLVYDRDSETYITFDGTAWADLATGGGGGSGLPNGGTTGQLLAKLSNTDGDADWLSPTAATFQGARVQLSANQNFNGDTKALILATNLIFDTDSLWDSTDSCFVIPAGITRVVVDCGSFWNNNGYNILFIEHNAGGGTAGYVGVAFQAMDVSIGTQVNSGVLAVTEGDKIRPSINTNASRTLQAGVGTFASIHVVG